MTRVELEEASDVIKSGRRRPQRVVVVGVRIVSQDPDVEPPIVAVVELGRQRHGHQIDEVRLPQAVVLIVQREKLQKTFVRFQSRRYANLKVAGSNPRA